MPRNEKQPQQLSLLIHIWQEQTGSVPVWRASVRHVSDGRRVGFANPDRAIDYLRNEVSAAVESHELGHSPPVDSD